MCTACGCGAEAASVASRSVPEFVDAPSGLPASVVNQRRADARDTHWHQHANGSWHNHAADDAIAHEPPEVAVADVPLTVSALTPRRRLQIERDILAKNDAHAGDNRRYFAEQGIFALNLVSSPGSGKTTLLCKTIERLRGRVAVTVIEGDQHTSRDAERIRATGAPALQINTGKGCHLDAATVGRAVQRLSPTDGSLLLIENVGNLVCPAAFDLGEAHKVVIFSVTEGEDKPLKYPEIFHAASLMLLNKIDLLPHLAFDVDLAIGFAQRVNPALQVRLVSATTGEGLDSWLEWLLRGCRASQQTRVAPTTSQRVAERDAQPPIAARG